MPSCARDRPPRGLYAAYLRKLAECRAERGEPPAPDVFSEEDWQQWRENNGISKPTKEELKMEFPEELSLDDLMAALEGKLRELSLAERMHAEFLIAAQRTRPQRAARNHQLATNGAMHMTDNTRTNTDRLLAAWRRGEHDLSTLRVISCPKPVTPAPPMSG